jgi:TATA-box binding protein (TBP) (component of TFIID and TFIIIB)
MIFITYGTIKLYKFSNKREKFKEKSKKIITEIKNPNIQKTTYKTKKLVLTEKFEFNIVGESFYQKTLINIAGGKSEEPVIPIQNATLKHDTKNRYDKNAVVVLIKNKKVGYFPKEQTELFHKFMKEKNLSSFTCKALLIGGWKGIKFDEETGEEYPSEGDFGVKLNIDWLKN